jgi:hypothetical protein
MYAGFRRTVQSIIINDIKERGSLKEASDFGANTIILDVLS